MNTNELVQVVNTHINSRFPEEISYEDLQQKFSAFIDDLIKNDFSVLISLLYKVDVSENKLKQLLKEQSGEDASGIIAKLIIDRLIQKIESRKNFHSSTNVNEDDKW